TRVSETRVSETRVSEQAVTHVQDRVNDDGQRFLVEFQLIGIGRDLSAGLDREQVLGDGRRNRADQRRQELIDTGPTWIEVKLNIGAVEIDFAFARQADDIADQVETAHGQAPAADAEQRVHFFEQRAVRPAQAEKLEQIDEQR